MKRTIWIGWDPREAAAFAVARHSAKRLLTQPIPVRGLMLDELRDMGLYARPTTMGWHANRQVLWDVISDAPMSTEHACARFFVPHLALNGWALFMDGDILVRTNLARVFEDLDPDKAVYCVQHKHRPRALTKMDGQAQTRYARKNWSSFMILNCDHPANRMLTHEFLNTTPGRDLHRFCWLEDAEIGELGPEWNYLVGHTKADADDPRVIHFTDGVPDMAGYENAPYASDWRAERRRWVMDEK